MGLLTKNRDLGGATGTKSKKPDWWSEDLGPRLRCISDVFSYPLSRCICYQFISKMA